MTFDQVVFLEIAKLLAPLAGSLLVAWFAVFWALGRFKREKLWERRLEA